PEEIGRIGLRRIGLQRPSARRHRLGHPPHLHHLPGQIHFGCDVHIRAYGTRAGGPPIIGRMGSSAPTRKFTLADLRAARESGVKLEAAESQLPAVRELADAGVAIMAHLGLRPQAVGVLGGYKAQGRTAEDAGRIVESARAMEKAGAASILLEAVPPEVAAAVVDATAIPVIGCGAGKACHGHVVVTHDTLGLTPRPPKFAPKLGDIASPMIQCFREYARRVTDGTYPAAEHGYEMPPDEKKRFVQRNPGSQTSQQNVHQE